MKKRVIEIELYERDVMYVDDRAYELGFTRSQYIQNLIDLEIMGLPPEEKRRRFGEPKKEETSETFEEFVAKLTPEDIAREEREYEELERLGEQIRKEIEERKGKLSQ